MSDIFSYNSMFYDDTNFACYYPKLITEVYMRPEFEISNGDLSNITREIFGSTKDFSNHKIILQNNIINKKNRKQLCHDQKIAKQKLHIQKRKIYTNKIRKY
jgi:hypothetical protein